MNIPRFIAFLLLLGAGSAFAETQEEKNNLFFSEKVRPILEKHCIKCHGGEKIRSGLKLLTREDVLKGGKHGSAVNLEQIGESRILKMISYEDPDLAMPPRGKLPQEQIEALSRWVERGLPWTPGQDFVGSVVEEKPRGGVVTPEAKKWWAYQPNRVPEIPKIKDPGWRHPIDAFIRHGVEAKGLRMAVPAGREALVRRVHYALTGLPPSPDEVKAFLADASPEAYEKLVDRLLASPQFGEHWARHWLDLVRYAESNGYERDSTKPHIWRYRDYVINAFNEDKPYTQFIREQLAGDELPNPGMDEISATGFYRLGIWDDEPADRLQHKYTVIDDILRTTSESMLAMTLGCARCHAHKIDPIPQEDYYSFLSFFHNITDNAKGGGNVIEKVVMNSKQHQKQEREKKQRESDLFNEIFAFQEKFKIALVKKDPAANVSGLRASDIDGLTYRFYRDTWSKLPDFDSLKAETEGQLAHNFFDLSPASRNEAVGFVFEGRLRVPATGDYTFYLDGRDGIRLSVDGKKVIDYDGLHAIGKPQKRTVPLKAGVYPVRLDYFNKDGGMAIQVGWSGPSFKTRYLSLPKNTLQERVILADARKTPQEWSYTTKAPKGNWNKPDVNTDVLTGWKKGKGGFGTPDTPGAVIHTTWNTPDIWIRRTFTVTPKPRALDLVILHDEDAEIYLNGTEVATVKGHIGAYTTIKLGPEAIKAVRNGPNLLAIHCRQTAGGQVIDAGLIEPADPKQDITQLIRERGAQVLDKAEVDRYFAKKKEVEDLRKQKPATGAAVDVMCVKERGSRAPDTFLFIRGSAHSPDKKVEPAFPEVLGFPPPEITEKPNGRNSSGRRLALANWIASPDNPLTSRVMVNRIWQHLFGRGIVRSTNNFGINGEAPTHPELLDWLASDFIAKDWKVKAMIKEIMMTRSYRMSSKGYSEALYEDPRNDLFWRQNMRRLAAEEVRDSLVHVTGKLNTRMGGPSFFPKLPQAVLSTASNPGQRWGRSSAEDMNRRSIYIFVRRSLLDPVLSGFDLADTDNSCAVRFTTIVPTQALTMMNSEFVNQQAEALAERLRGAGDLEAQVKLGVELALQRPATKVDVADGLDFLEEMKEKEKLDDKAAMDRFALMLLNLNEFMFLD